jgi:hemoglobin
VVEQMNEIYEKYGGYDFFHGCIYGLYIEMFDHPEISYHFIGVDIEWLSRAQTNFLVRAIGGPDQYQGQTLDIVHKHMKITPFQFREIAKAFRKVFIDKGVSQTDADMILEFVKSYQGQIVTAKTSLWDEVMRPIYRWWAKIKKAL